MTTPESTATPPPDEKRKTAVRRPQASTGTLFDVVKQFKRGIVIALSLVVIEHVAWIVEPSLFGNLIDATIDKATGETATYPLWPLFLWVAAFLVNSGVGAARRSIDQRIYLRMFTQVASSVSRAAVAKRLSISKTAARAQLSREFITFFQYRVPEIGEQAIAIGGAMIGLAIFDYRISLSCLVVGIPLLIIQRVYTKRVVALQSSIHDGVEETYDIFATKDPEKVESYYTALAVPQQKIADWGALSFGLIRIVLLGIFLVVLYISIDLNEFTTGNIYAIVAYLWTFVTSSEYLPELLESWTSLKDISNRLREEQV
jgi:ABC-type multidrug transport system fused ATPase/permease subunit